MTAVLQTPIESTPSPLSKTESYFKLKSLGSKNLITHLHAISQSPREQFRSTTDRAGPNIALPDTLSHEAELIPYAGTVFNAKDYVFLGSCEMPIVSNMGITLSETGRLLLIAGHCRDAISGLFHKFLHNDSYCYYIFSELAQPYRLRFDHLYVDEQGALLGRVKNSEYYYRITINKKSSYHTDNNVRSTAIITYEKQDTKPEKHFIFHDQHHRSRGITCKDGNLFFTSDKATNTEHSACELPLKITSSLDKKYQVASVKRARNLLQIEAIRKKKRRIFYLDPRNISIHNVNAKGISHKPPQTFYSYLGGDVHEKYHAGQPFSSRRLSNFSSAHIPIFSTAIDNIRYQTKKSKQHRIREKRKASILPYLAKTIDPGLRAMVSATRDITHSHEHHPHNGKKNIERHNNAMAKTCVSLLHELPDNIADDKSYAGVTALLRYLAIHDSITFSNMSELSLFFSMLQSGTPLSHGWFSGIIVAFVKNHSMTLSKTESGNIRIRFLHKRKISCNLLAGTGQGLELGKITRQDISLLSMVPFEANIVLSVYKNKETSFSFDLTEAQFQDFMRYATAPTSSITYPTLNHQMTNQIKEYGSSLSLDMKINELRAMVGVQPNTNINLMFPRVTCAIGLNSEILSLKHKKERGITTSPSQSEKEKSSTTLRALTVAGGPSVGGKIIVSPSMPNAEGKLGFRLALFEEGKGKKIKTKSGLKTAWQHSATPEMPSTNRRKIVRIQRMLATMDAKGDVIRPIRLLRRIKVTRTLQLKRNPFQTRIARLFTKTRHPSHERLSHVLKGHHNKNEIIHTLSEIRSRARHIQRANMNKRFTHYFVAKYTLNEEYQQTLNNLKDELARLVENAEGISRVSQRMRLAQLQRRVRQLRNRARYRLNTIEIKSIGEVSKSKGSLLNVLISFKNSKTLSYTKHLGEIQFEYANHGDNVPQKITGNYQFL